MSRNRLLPLVIVLLFIPPLSPQALAGPEAASSSARSRWSGPVQLTNSTNSSWDPSTYVDGSGNIHLAWQDGTDRTSIRYKSFAPSGEVIVNDTVLVDHIDSEPPIYLSSRPLAPRLDFNDGELVLFWNETENHPSGQTGHDESLGMLRFSPDLKSKRDCWLPIFAVDRLYYGNPLYAFDSKGNIHFVYAGNSEWNGEPDVWYVKTNSTGAKLFSKFLARNETEVGVAVDEEDNVHLVWRNETGNLTYSRLDPNGTELCRIDQIQGINYSISTFTIVAKNLDAGANIYWNERDVYQSSISPNGTAKTIYMFNGHEQGRPFSYASRYPQIARSDKKGSNYIFGYGYCQRQGGHTFPYDILMGMIDEEGAKQPDCEAVEGMDLVDQGYTEVGPSFSAYVIARGSSGSYAYVAYSNDRQTWEDPAGGMNIYLDILGPYTTDLSVHGIGFSNQSPLEQENVTIWVEVEYYGSYPPVDLPVDFDVELLIDGVLVNSSHRSIYKMDVMTFNWTASRGLHNCSARVMSGLAELNMSNNEMNAALYVFGRPDISVKEIVWDPPAPLVGDRVNITARVVNAGETAGNFTWGIELNGSVLMTDAARLGPGEWGNFSTQWTPALPGNYTFLAQANGTVPYELELGNNSMLRTVRVSPPPLSIDILEPSNGSAVTGVVDIRGIVGGMWGVPSLILEIDGEKVGPTPLYFTGEWHFLWNTTTYGNGNHTILARVENAYVNSPAMISVLVDNPVAILSPPGDLEVFENQTALFEAKLLGKLSQDTTFVWTVDESQTDDYDPGIGHEKYNITKKGTEGGILSRLEFRTNFHSAGLYRMKVNIRYFVGIWATSSYIWNLTVKNVNQAPQIRSFFPSVDISILSTDGRTFGVTAYDEDNDNLTFTWFLDGNVSQAGRLEVFRFDANGKSGARHVTVIVSDGELQASQSWTVTVTHKKAAAPNDIIWWPWAVLAIMSAAIIAGLWAVYRLRKPPKPA